MSSVKARFSERRYAQTVFGEAIDGTDTLAWQDRILDGWDEYSRHKNPSFCQTIAFAKLVQEGITNDLSFRNILSSPEIRLEPDEIARNKSTNCYGNTIITSEVLEAFGVDHYIAFVNQHSFVWLQDVLSG